MFRELKLWRNYFQLPHSALKSMTPGSQDYLKFYLNNSLSYAVSVHDELFYLNNINPNGPPTNRRTFNGSRADHYLTLTMTEHVKLNLARDPCRQDLNYSFILCVRESLAKQVLSILNLSFLKIVRLSPVWFNVEVWRHILCFTKDLTCLHC